MTEENKSSIREPYRDRLPSSIKPKSNLQYVIPFILAIAIIYSMVFLRLPYYIYSPGSAEQIRPMVQVKQGGFPEKGVFMLTTVSVRETNVLGYLSAQIKTDEQLVKKKFIRPATESANEYNERQAYVMQSSQGNAIIAAYTLAKIPYSIRIDRVLVLNTNQDTMASKLLFPGDILEQVDNIKITKSQDFTDYLAEKKLGDTVNIKLIRDKVSREENITLVLLPADPTSVNSKPYPGLGISVVNMQSIHPGDEKKQVTVKAGEIGGPSAGLMFALEIYNQLVAGDITKGYRIAGTGTIGGENKEITEVGAIGGIEHKIVAAERAGSDYFLTPAANMKDAQAKADKINAHMKLIAIATMEDALKFLNNLSQKES